MEKKKKKKNFCYLKEINLKFKQTIVDVMKLFYYEIISFIKWFLENKTT